MWDTVGIVAGVVVMILMFQVLDVADTLKDRLRTGSPRKDMENRVARLEERLDAMDRERGRSAT